MRKVTSGNTSREKTEKVTVIVENIQITAVSYTHLRAHETLRYLVCRLLLEKKKFSHREKSTANREYSEFY